MNGIKFRYNFINIAVILITAALFINDYKNIGTVFRSCGFLYVLIIVLTVFVVHAIKASRLYLILYESDISFKKYLKAYCKVTFVSVVIPYKLGEFFRMYCYGRILGNTFKGIFIVLLDRFMDTIALVTILLLVWVFNGGAYITSFVYLLLIFFVGVLIVYLTFPGVYKFWKRNILEAKATECKLSALRMLDASNHIYEEMKGISQGKGIVLYLMSLIAWGIEIGSVILQIGLLGSGGLNQRVSHYLISTMNNVWSTELKQFVFVSVVMMMVIYIIMNLWGVLQRRKDLE